MKMLHIIYCFSAIKSWFSHKHVAFCQKTKNSIFDKKSKRLIVLLLLLPSSKTNFLILNSTGMCSFYIHTLLKTKAVHLFCIVYVVYGIMEMEKIFCFI